MIAQTIACVYKINVKQTQNCRFRKRSSKSRSLPATSISSYYRRFQFLSLHGVNHFIHGWIIPTHTITLARFIVRGAATKERLMFFLTHREIHFSVPNIIKNILLLLSKQEWNDRIFFSINRHFYFRYPVRCPFQQILHFPHFWKISTSK